MYRSDGRGLSLPVPPSPRRSLLPALHLSSPGKNTKSICVVSAHYITACSTKN